jgi:hypothetical protein
MYSTSSPTIEWIAKLGGSLTYVALGRLNGSTLEISGLTDAISRVYTKAYQVSTERLVEGM